MTIKEAREARSWSLNEAATRAGVSRQGLINLENGKTSPGDVKLGTALSLLMLFWPDVSLTEFFGHEGIPPAQPHPTLLFRLEPRDGFAWAHLLAASTSDFRIART